MIGARGSQKNNCTLVSTQGAEKAVMKKTTSIAAVMVVLLLAHSVQAGVSIVKNGSFEADGSIGDIKVVAPRYWCDVNLPDDKFTGYVGEYWTTHGDYALTIRVEPEPTVAGDIAMVSEQVYLGGVNKIIFDVKLSSALSFIPWDSNVRSAVVLIDGNDIWDSNNFQPNEQGEYLNQEVDVNGIDGASLHALSLAVRTNVDDLPDVDYYADWDFVKFDTHCGGFGYLPEDLDQDCFVDMNDLKVLAEVWLVEEPSQRYDLFKDGIVNFRDFAFLAEYWKSNSYWGNWGDDNCYEMELLASDLNYDGIVNLVDFAVLSSDWMKEGNCINCDIDNSGAVDYKDLSIMSDEWLLKSWLYDLM